MRLDRANGSSENIRRSDMYLIEQEEPPFPRGEELHHLCRGVGSLRGVCYHRVGGDDDACCARELGMKKEEKVSWSRQRNFRRSEWR